MSRQHLPKPATVGQDQIALQFGQPLWRDPRIGQQAEASVDAINGFATRNDAFDGGGRGADTVEAGVVELAGRALPQLAESSEVDGGGVESHHVSPRSS